MRNFLFALIAAGTVTAAVATPAEATGGCGAYAHRNYYGACVAGGQWGYAPRAYFGGPRYGYGYGYGWRRPAYRPYGFYHHPHYYY